MGIEGGRKPYGKIKTAASIAAELVAPSLISERLRMKRGSKLSSLGGIARESTIVEGAAIGGGMVFGDPRITIVGYIFGKGMELTDIGYQKVVLEAVKRQKK